MTKIKITKETKEFIGTVENKVATPFGNSAHINVGKKHTGKIIPIIIPKDAEYKWVLPNDDFDLTVKECEKQLKKEKGRLKFHKKSAVENLKSGRFELDDLRWVISLLEKNVDNIPLVVKIKSTYDLGKQKI